MCVYLCVSVCVCVYLCVVVHQVQGIAQQQGLIVLNKGAGATPGGGTDQAALVQHLRLQQLIQQQQQQQQHAVGQHGGALATVQVRPTLPTTTQYTAQQAQQQVSTNNST